MDIQNQIIVEMETMNKFSPIMEGVEAAHKTDMANSHIPARKKFKR